MINEFIDEITVLKDKERMLYEVMMNLSEFFTWEKKLGVANGYKNKLKENLRDYLDYMYRTEVKNGREKED